MLTAIGLGIIFGIAALIAAGGLGFFIGVCYAED